MTTAAPVGSGCETNPLSVGKSMMSIVGSRYSRSSRRRCRRRLPDPPAATSSRSVAGRDLVGTTVARGNTRCGDVSVGRRLHTGRALMESSMPESAF